MPIDKHSAGIASGALIGNYIFTAAHVGEKVTPKSEFIVSGIGQIPNTIVSIHRHSGFNANAPFRKRFDNDIAVIELKNKYQTDIRLADRSEASKFSSDQDLLWFGYGRDKDGASGNLVGSKIGKIVGSTLRGLLFVGSAEFRLLPPSKSHIVTMDESVYSTQGDSGGPVLKLDNDKYLLLALISGGRKNSPNMAVRTAPLYSYLSQRGIRLEELNRDASDNSLKSTCRTFLSSVSRFARSISEH